MCVLFFGFNFLAYNKNDVNSDQPKNNITISSIIIIIILLK